MKVQVINKFQMCKDDYTFIKTQLRNKGLKIGKIAKECGMTRANLYEVLRGYYSCPEKVIKVLQAHEIIIPYCDYYYETI